MNEKRGIPEWQQIIRDKCYHPTGVWEAFPESEYETSIPARFEKTAACFPDNLAVADAQRSLTYGELNTAANRLAHGLLARLGPDPEPIAHLFTHNVDAVVALLGILKAGKFYAPLDPRAPADYLRRILSQLDSRMLLTEPSKQELAQAAAGTLAAVFLPEEIEAQTTDNPLLPLGPDACAYVVFTSGSTGNPKGVLENHRNIVRFAAHFANSIHSTSQDRAILPQLLSFSGSKQTLFGTILTGSQLFLYDTQQQGLAGLPGWVRQQGITILTLAPAHFRSLAEGGQTAADFASVRLLRVATDWVLPADLIAFCRMMPDTALFRTGLGASEAKVVAEIFYDKARAARTKQVSVGWPLPDTKLLLVDESDHPVFQGQSGEIVVHSRFVSLGYWKEPALTASKFRPDPDKKGHFFYRFGDLGRFGKDGQLYFLGRADSQVKIRGQRVDLGEVEQALLALPGIAGAVADLRGDSPAQQMLIAWVVCRDPAQQPTVSSLHQMLAERLPSPMIPQRFVFLDRFPLNRNEKINRLALPLPAEVRPRLDSGYLAPRTPLESEIAQVWSDVLAINGIGIRDNFFELGGDSIRAMRILSRLQSLNPSLLHIAAIFDAPTIAQLAIYLTAHYLQTEKKQGKPLTEWAAGSESIDTDTTLSPGEIQRFRELLEQRFWTEKPKPQPVLESRNRPAIFILAPPRSGTTLLRAMLGGHPRLFAPPELYLLSHTDLNERRRVNRDPYGHRLEGTVRALMALHRCSSDEALALMAGYESEGMTTKDFYGLLQSATADRILVDKTPYYASHLKILRRAEAWFDSPLFIHLGRHPLAVMESYVRNRFYLKSEFRHDFAPDKLAELMWLVYHQNIVAFQQEVPPQRFFHLPFEELVVRPESVLRGLCDFLGLDFHPAVLEPYANTDERMTDGLHPESWMVGDPNFHQHRRIRADFSQSWRAAGVSFALGETSRALAHTLGYDT